MADSNITDFVIELQGANDASVIDKFQGPDVLSLDLTVYKRRQNISQKSRNFVHMGRGASDTGQNSLLEPKITQAIIDDILKVRKAGRQIGAVCISGYSKGSIYALRLAQQLKENGVAVLYIGLADLPLFPFGYNPKVAEFGVDMMPSNRPEPDPRLFGRGDLPPRARFPPKVTPPSITAKIKKNYFQNEGNGMKPSKQKFPFWWASNLANDEIHGELDDDSWNNIQLFISHQINDADYHEEGDHQGLQKISADISAELALVVPSPTAS